jgi:hypothetical protein
MEDLFAILELYDACIRHVKLPGLESELDRHAREGVELGQKLQLRDACICLVKPLHGALANTLSERFLCLWFGFSCKRVERSHLELEALSHDCDGDCGTRWTPLRRQRSWVDDVGKKNFEP